MYGSELLSGPIQVLSETHLKIAKGIQIVLDVMEEDYFKQCWAGGKSEFAIFFLSE